MGPVILFLAPLLALYAVARARFWIGEGAKLQNSGYLPPAPSWLAHRFMYLACRILVFFAVGPVKAIGVEHAHFDGRMVVSANHQEEWDFAVLQGVLNFAYRLMAAAEHLCGFRAPLAAWIGAFGIQYDRSEDRQAAVRAAVEVLKSDRQTRMQIYPQGQLIRDNVLRPEQFRTGTVRALQQVAAETGEPAAILPVAIHYLRSPNHATPLHTRILNLGTWIEQLVKPGDKPYRCLRRRNRKSFVQDIKRSGMRRGHARVLIAGLRCLWRGEDIVRRAPYALTRPIGKLVQRFRRLFGRALYGAIVVVGPPIRIEDLPADPRQATEQLRRVIQRLLDVAVLYDSHKAKAVLASEPPQRQLAHA